ncbi:MAG: oxidative damage protection protein [Ectothiorhodospiraceae bacterium AqS1]|nr:oxidative damage protection protein [Ectothiorhodospiraceae bacterium AqS1]
MTRTVQCKMLGREAPGLDEAPWPGELGQRIYENISAEAWNDWLQRLQMIVNENQLSTADPQSIALIERHMLGFFFKEGDLGGLPAGFRGGRSKK